MENTFAAYLKDTLENMVAMDIKYFQERGFEKGVKTAVETLNILNMEFALVQRKRALEPDELTFFTETSKAIHHLLGLYCRLAAAGSATPVLN